LGEKVIVAVNNHQIADNEVGIHATRCVRNEECLDT